MSPIDPSAFNRCTERELGKLYADSTYSPLPSTVMKMGRCGSSTAPPSGWRSPDESTRNAFR